MNYIEPGTGRTYPLDTPRWRGDSGHYLELEASPGLRRSDIDQQCRSIWRYAKALPVAASTAVSMGEGWTPLVDGDWDGAPVRFKLEFMMPTGSFKDRGTSVMVSYLKSHGVRHVLEDSSGNAGASLSAYAARAGIHCRILVPETASFGKIAQIAACGAEVVMIPGPRQAVADEAVRQADEIFYASHNWQPTFVEGIKTLAYEIWEQSGYTVPDNIVMPLGYGSNVLGCRRGFEELMRNGEIDRMPRLFGVQAANCAPLYAAFASGADTTGDIQVKPTLAEGIASSKPTRGREVLASIRASGGAVVQVQEDEIVAALRAYAHKGLFIEPTSAVTGAALSQLLKGGTIDRSQSTVVVLTGSGLKASSTIGQALGLGIGTDKAGG
ncbi:threonine synthase [Noviherbaspirillum sp.]|uniref:threonine synthase n=1 Tax=Noviherbaspirillum sp. TaxID=1926288 RepID=UPI002B46BF48|nr:threonine synthase [Noviherbaspirillum sp.]HJV82391.1 threonine synthase [Noviherbaspirillum sp.]